MAAGRCLRLTREFVRLRNREGRRNGTLPAPPSARYESIRSLFSTLKTPNVDRAMNSAF